MKKIILILGVFLISHLGVLSCGQSGVKNNCCMKKNIGIGTVYSGSFFSKKRVATNCALSGGNFLEGQCPQEKLVDKCIINKGKRGEFILYYYSPKHNKAGVKNLCKRANGELL